MSYISSLSLQNTKKEKEKIAFAQISLGLMLLEFSSSQTVIIQVPALHFGPWEIKQPLEC